MLCSVPSLDCKEPECDTGWQAVLHCQHCWDNLLLQINSLQHQFSTFLTQATYPAILRLHYPLMAGLPACALLPLQLIQNAEARLVVNLPLTACQTLGNQSLLESHIFSYHAANGSSPSHIKDMVKPYNLAHPLHSATADHQQFNKIQTVWHIFHYRLKTNLSRIHHGPKTFSLSLIVFLNVAIEAIRHITWSWCTCIILKIWVVSTWLNALIADCFEVWIALEVNKCNKKDPLRSQASGCLPCGAEQIVFIGFFRAHLLRTAARSGRKQCSESGESELHKKLPAEQINETQAETESIKTREAANL